MNREDIIRMAREATKDRDGSIDWVFSDEELTRFAALVADNAIKPWAKQLKIERKKFQELNEISVGAMQAVRLDEREACAKVCEGYAPVMPKSGAKFFAAAIRARGT